MDQLSSVPEFRFLYPSGMLLPHEFLPSQVYLGPCHEDGLWSEGGVSELQCPLIYDGNDETYIPGDMRKPGLITW